MNNSGSTAAISTGPNPAKPFVRGRSLTDMLRGLVLQPSVTTGSGLSSSMMIEEEHDTSSSLESSSTAGKPGLKRRDTIGVIPTSQVNDSPQPISVNLGRIVESQGMTATSTPAPAVSADGSGRSWSFFWKNSAQKVIDNNRAATGSTGMENGTSNESQNKILGAYLSQTDGGLGTQQNHHQGSLLSAATQGMTANGVPQGDLGTAKGGRFLNLPDKMNVRTKEVHMFSPSSF